MPPDCICDFPSTCGGSGLLRCRGCGGTFCACLACFGQGEIECDGCEDCWDELVTSEVFAESDEAAVLEGGPDA